MNPPLAPRSIVERPTVNPVPRCQLCGGPVDGHVGYGLYTCGCGGTSMGAKAFAEWEMDRALIIHLLNGTAATLADFEAAYQRWADFGSVYPDLDSGGITEAI